jgi:predicted nucleic acid-binding protein
MRPILADSSWYIQQSRSRQDPFAQLGQYAVAREIAICGMVIAEISRGLRERSTLKKHQQKWRLMRYIPSNQSVWRITSELAWQLDRQGHVLPIQDIHIAACALSINAVLLTHDPHFQEIPGLDATERIL